MPQFAGPFKRGSLIVSTYHSTGIPGSNRTIEVDWPSALKVPISGVPPERDDGAERTMIFDFAQLLEDPLGFSIKINAADKLPLYSFLGLEAGQPDHGTVLRHPSGHTFISSEGFEIVDRPFLEGWTGFRYPNARAPGNDQDSWFFGETDVDGITGILSCRTDNEGFYSRCRLKKKVEPIFYEVRFNANKLEEFETIEKLSDQLVSCMMNGF